MNRIHSDNELADAIKIAVGEVVKARRVLATHLSTLGGLLESAGVRWDDLPKAADSDDLSLSTPP